MKSRKKHNSELRLVSFAALLGIVFMVVFSGVQLAEVPSLIGQGVKFAIIKGTSTTTCSETDSGNEKTVKGITSVQQESSLKKTKTDNCVDDEKLKEYYCERNKIKEAEYECSCEDGACVSYKKAEEMIGITSATYITT